MMVGAVKTRPLSTEEIPPEKNSFFNISENQVCFKYFLTKIDLWEKFEREQFFEPKSTSPLLETLGLKCPGTLLYSSVWCRSALKFPSSEFTAVQCCFRN